MRGDHVTYALRGWSLAPVSHALLVRNQIAQIFDHRARIIAHVFTTGKAEAGQ